MESYKILHPRNTHEKNILDLRNTHEKIFFGPTKYQQENILDIGNTYEKKFQTHECKMTRWNKTHENLTHSKFFNLFG